MSQDSINPYATPAIDPAAVAMPGSENDPGGEVQAGRFTRFAAAVVDGILVSLIILPIQFATGFLDRTSSGEVGPIEWWCLPR